jgi:methionine-rich copper-binding protein CopC
MKPTHYFMKIKSLFSMAGLFLVGATLAQAHAFLDHAEPRVGSTLTTPPTQVKIWFTEEVEPAFTKIKVTDASGKEVDLKDDKVDPSNQAIMTVSLPKLAPGAYKVSWSAIAVDTHHTTGTFPFTVTAP